MDIDEFRGAHAGREPNRNNVNSTFAGTGGRGRAGGAPA